MSDITFRFVAGGDDFVSRAIRAGCYGYLYTHVEARMPDGLLLGAHADGGVMARKPGYDAGTFVKDEFVTIAAAQPVADAFHAFLTAQLGKPYDMEVIAAIAASAVIGERDWRAPDSWICSELQAAAAEACKLIGMLATGVNHVTPRDFRIALSALGV